MDHLLPVYLGYARLEPVFSYGIKFETEALREYKLLKKKKSLLAMATKAAERVGK